MLVLSRKSHEQIMLGDDIIITIVDIRGEKARIGVDAPKDLPVHRMEIYEMLQRESEKASQGAEEAQ